jgi:hypothetical protein
MFRPSMGVIIMPIKNCKFLKYMKCTSAQFDPIWLELVVLFI